LIAVAAYQFFTAEKVVEEDELDEEEEMDEVETAEEEIKA
jgi:hypothetical protein